MQSSRCDLAWGPRRMGGSRHNHWRCTGPRLPEHQHVLSGMKCGRLSLDTYWRSRFCETLCAVDSECTPAFEFVDRPACRCNWRGAFVASRTLMKQRLWVRLVASEFQPMRSDTGVPLHKAKLDPSCRL